MLSQSFLFFAFRAWWVGQHVEWPFAAHSFDDSDNSLVLWVSTTHPLYQIASDANSNVVLDGFFQGDNFVNAASWQVPQELFHGTTIPSVLLIFKQLSLLSASELGDEPHAPDGVYAYGDQRISWESMYNRGVQLRMNFTGVACPDSLCNAMKYVPIGVVCRKMRSQSKRSGRAGAEYISNGLSLRLRSVRIDFAKLERFLMMHWFPLQRQVDQQVQHPTYRQPAKACFVLLFCVLCILSCM